MILDTAHPYDVVAALLEYPDAGHATLCELAIERVRERAPRAASRLADHLTLVRGEDVRALEEMYTRCFDLQAAVCLEVGWQIFGETYTRGSFLVKLRQALRVHAVPEGGELPDFLPVVLRLLARLPSDEDPRGLVKEAVLPAIAKMLQGLPETHPYALLLDATRYLLAADFRIERMPEAPAEMGTYTPPGSEERRNRAPRVDACQSPLDPGAPS